MVAERKAAVAAAEASLTLAQQTYDRIKQLTAGRLRIRRRSSTRRPRRSMSRDATLEQAKLAYDEAVAGYTAEERGVAQAAVAKAEAAIATLQAQVGEMTVKAPIGGQVYQIGAELGEYVSPGVPLLSLVDLGDVWLRFDLREDLVKGSEGRRPLRRHGSGARRQAGHRRGPHDRDARRICRLARDPRDRRLRSQDLRGPGLSGRQASPSCRPGMSAYADWTGAR